MLLGAPRKERTLPIASVWTSSLRNSKRIHFCSFKAPRWWHYLQQRLQTTSSRLWSQRVVGVGRAPALEWGRGRGSPVGAVKYLGMGGRARAGGHRRQALSKGPTGRRCFVLFPFSTILPTSRPFLSGQTETGPQRSRSSLTSASRIFLEDPSCCLPGNALITQSLEGAKQFISKLWLWQNKLLQRFVSYSLFVVNLLG